MIRGEWYFGILCGDAPNNLASSTPTARATGSPRGGPSDNATVAPRRLLRETTVLNRSGPNENFTGHPSHLNSLLYDAGVAWTRLLRQIGACPRGSGSSREESEAQRTPRNEPDRLLRTRGSIMSATVPLSTREADTFLVIILPTSGWGRACQAEPFNRAAGSSINATAAFMDTEYCSMYVGDMRTNRLLTLDS